MKKTWLIACGILLLGGCSSAANNQKPSVDYSNYKGVWMDQGGKTIVELVLTNGKGKAEITIKDQSGISNTLDENLTKEKEKSSAFSFANGDGEFVFNNSKNATLSLTKNNTKNNYSLIPYDAKKMKNNSENQEVYAGERVIKNQLELLGASDLQISFVNVQKVKNEDVYHYVLYPSGEDASSAKKEAFFNSKTGEVTFQNKQ